MISTQYESINHLALFPMITVVKAEGKREITIKRCLLFVTLKSIGNGHKSANPLK